ncbi:MAG: hypothetical protein LOD85_05330 [Clostridia bacterium]
MARQDEIARFVAGFFTLNGAVLRWVDAGVLEVEVPEALRSRLGVCRKLRLAFSPRAAESGPDQRVEYLTLGHPLLDRLLDEARSRGRTASVILPHGLDRELLEALSTANPFGTRSSRNRSGSAPAAELREGSRPRPEDAPAAWRDLERRLGRLVFRVAGVKPLAARLVFHTQVMFFFRVSFISDEKRERTVSLLIDPYTEEIDRPVDLKAAAPFDLGSGGLEGEPYALHRLYRRACDHLARRLARETGAYQAAVEARLRREERRIEEYYAGLIQERVDPLRKLFRRMAAARVGAELARSWSTGERYRQAFAALQQKADRLGAECEKELALLEREKEQRLREVREKHRARVEITLTQAALVRVPRVEWRLLLSGSVQREVTVLYDLARRRLVGWECESCSGPLGDEVSLCQCRALVCRTCATHCPGCGRAVCRACAPARCHLCGGPVCPACGPECRAGLAGPGGPPAVCAACAAQYCGPCAAALSFLAETTGGERA